jgi:FMN phosphatase YigB (HAD superfamily)
MKRLLDKFPVLLFDMGGTFVFDCDKFGVNEDFYQTYCSVAGKALSSQEVTRLNAQPYEILFIGDNTERDMEGAKNVGLATAWVTPRTNRHPSVDYVISNIQELETYVT